MAPSFINIHYTTILLVLLFGIKLHAQRESRNIDMRYYWLTLFCCALLVVQDQLETVASLNVELKTWRTLFSVLGYVLRPTAAIGLLMVVCPAEKRSWKI